MKVKIMNSFYDFFSPHGNILLLSQPIFIIEKITVSATHTVHASRINCYSALISLLSDMILTVGMTVEQRMLRTVRLHSASSPWAWGRS